MTIIAIGESSINETMKAIMHSGMPVATTEQLASFYETDVLRLRKNHHRNKCRFVEGKHYFKLEGAELKGFKDRVSLRYSVKIHTNIKALTLWTERGAARHAKMLETDRAWDVFEKLEDFYFSQREGDISQHHGRVGKVEHTTVDDRTPLRGIVNRVMGKYGLTYQAVYRLIHKEFDVEHIDELSPAQVLGAIEYLATKVIEGEFISKQKLPVSPLSQQDLVNLVWLWDYSNRSKSLFRSVLPAIEQLKSPYAPMIYDHAYDLGRIADSAKGILDKLTDQIDESSIESSPGALRRLRTNTLPPRY